MTTITMALAMLTTTMTKTGTRVTKKFFPCSFAIASTELLMLVSIDDVNAFLLVLGVFYPHQRLVK